MSQRTKGVEEANPIKASFKSAVSSNVTKSTVLARSNMEDSDRGEKLSPFARLRALMVVVPILPPGLLRCV